MRSATAAGAGEGVPDGAAEAIAELVSTIPVVERVYLFGSRMLGTASAASDLDIAVETSGATPDEQLAAYIAEVAHDPRWTELSRRFATRMGITPLAEVRADALLHGRLIYFAT
ncbi:MAG: nucleotidyltransferase domain-containing protein [Croceibacterium sp.]